MVTVMLASNVRDNLNTRNPLARIGCGLKLIGLQSHMSVTGALALRNALVEFGILSWVLEDGRPSVHGDVGDVAPHTSRATQIRGTDRPAQDTETNALVELAAGSSDALCDLHVIAGRPTDGCSVTQCADRRWEAPVAEDASKARNRSSVPGDPWPALWKHGGGCVGMYSGGGLDTAPYGAPEPTRFGPRFGLVYTLHLQSRAAGFFRWITGDSFGTVRRGSHWWRSWWLRGCDQGSPARSLNSFVVASATCPMLESLNVGCIPSKAMLNHSHIYHQTIYDIKKRGIDEPPTDAQSEGRLRERSHEMYQILFKQNKADYFKGTASFVCPNTISVQLIEGGESTVEAKNIIVAKGSEVAPLPGGTIGKVPEKMVVIGGGIIGLEMGIETVPEIADEATSQVQVEHQGALRRVKGRESGHHDGGCQGWKVGLKNSHGMRQLKADVVFVANSRRPYIQGLGLENVGVEVDSRRHIVIDDQLNTSVPNMKRTGDVTFGLMLAHEAEEEGIAAVEYIHSGHGHVNYGMIPSVVYTHPETEQELKTGGVMYKVGRFAFLANSRAKTNLDTEGQVKFLVEVDSETDWILGVHIIGPNAGEMIAKGVLALEYAASAENFARTTHIHKSLSEAFREAPLQVSSGNTTIHF
ncbi:hypothetical protein H4582DRAFT_2131008 [Lactarius indigo]|nr:hypothetical protein H4582DRAFT_2131008 [Lactarius indigo]